MKISTLTIRTAIKIPRLERGRSGLSFPHKFQFSEIFHTNSFFNVPKYLTKNKIFYSKLKISTLTTRTTIKLPRLERGRSELSFTHKF